MNPVIVIGTSKGRDCWRKDCLASLVRDIGKVQIHVFYSDAFELSVIYRAAKLFDSFIFVPDSTIFLDTKTLLDKCFDEYAGLSVSLSQFPNAFGMYLGKYMSAEVLSLQQPSVVTKLDAVRYESEWCKQYAALHAYKELGNLPHSNVFEQRHGRLNMVCENEYLRRYKGSWNVQTMMNEHMRIRNG